MVKLNDKRFKSCLLNVVQFYIKHIIKYKKIKKHINY